MKKSFNNNTNNIIIQKNKNIIYLDNKSIIKNNDGKNNLEQKEFQLNKNLIINNFNSNNINKQHQIKTAKGSPLSINNKILKQISKITTKQTIHNNIDKIPTVIFNINSNQIKDKNIKNVQNSNESKSNNKSKSNESNKSKIIKYKKAGNQCNLIKKSIKKENNFNNNIIKTKTQINQKTIKKTNNNLHKNIINKKQLNENNSYKTNNPYNFYFNNNNQKLNIGTSFSLTSNKNNLAGLYYINNLINKNSLSNFKTTSTTTKNSIKSSKEKNNQNSNNNYKKDNSNENKKINAINSKLISIGTKKKISQQKLIIQNNNNLNSIMKKFSISNINKNKKVKKELNHKIIDNLSNSKNITLIGKNNISNLSNLSNFYSINILSKSFANSKKNFKKDTNFYKTKIETKIQNNNAFHKKSNKYFDNIGNHNIFPITISHYKNNYININININNKKNNIKTSNNNICNINKVIKNNIRNQKSKNSKKKTLSTNNTKIMNKINNKYKKKKK